MGLKTTPDLNLPDCEETLAFRALEKVLSNDGVFSRTITVFDTWSGDDIGQNEPTWAMCPFCFMTARSVESDWITESQHDMPLLITLQVGVKGTKYDNLANFWAVIRRAIFPADVAEAEAVRAVLRGAGAHLVTKPTVTLNAYTIKYEAAGNPMLVGEGSIRLGLHIRT